MQSRMQKAHFHNNSGNKKLECLPNDEPLENVNEMRRKTNRQQTQILSIQEFAYTSRSFHSLKTDFLVPHENKDAMLEMRMYC
jgi:hypothetical protein